MRRRTTQESREILTVTAHAHRQAFLEAAVLATIAMVFGHFAVFAPAARVAQLLADGSLEESFASLAADGTVVTTCGRKMNEATGGKKRMDPVALPDARSPHTTQYSTDRAMAPRADFSDATKLIGATEAEVSIFIGIQHVVQLGQWHNTRMTGGG